MKPARLPIAKRRLPITNLNEFERQSFAKTIKFSQSAGRTIPKLPKRAGVVNSARKPVKRIFQ